MSRIAILLYYSLLIHISGICLFQLYKVNRLLFIGCTDGLYTCNLTLFTATLAAAVGILKPGSDAIITAMTQITKVSLNFTVLLL